MVVCVTARENYILEGAEARGIVGPQKYAAVGVEFTEPALLWPAGTLAPPTTLEQGQAGKTVERG
jgi:hypothetical protein